ncbi:hypothetical protein M3Y97_00133800 [Aphelenchoides bicaudatus]|nr:hypothetical protein M3Y97_00133800 [Aphelenchoides bicaudatus]
MSELLSCDELLTELEAVKNERDELKLKCKEQAALIHKLTTRIIPQSADVQFNSYANEEENEVLAAELPAFAEYIDYSVASMKYLSEQWKVARLYKNLNDEQKRLFNFFHQMYMISKEFPKDEADKFHLLNLTHMLNCFYGLAKSIERVIPGGCWLVKEGISQNNKGRAVIKFGTGNGELKFIMSRLVFQLNYGTIAVKDLHASHLCDTADCMNPNHIFPEPASINLHDRPKCFSVGSAKTCKCVPSCIFVRNGQLLECRNDSKLSDCICGADCFKEVRKELKRLASRKRPRNDDEEPIFDVRPIQEAEWTDDNRLMTDGKVLSVQNNYGVYTTWRCQKIWNGKERCAATAYSDARVFFEIKEHRC